MEHWDVNQWVTLLGAVGILAGVLATAVVKVITALQKVAGKVDALEIKVDGRLTQLLERTAQTYRAAGIEAGRGEMIVPVPARDPALLPAHILAPIPIPLPVVVVGEEPAAGPLPAPPRETGK